MVKIRKANLKDIKEIDRIYFEGSIDEGRLQFPKVSKKEMIRELNRASKERINGFRKEIVNKKHYWIIYGEGDILGFGQAWIKNKEEGILEKIYVDRKARRKGIATKIAKELIKWLKNKKIKHIEAGLYWENFKSRKLNEKLGFKPISLRMRLKQ